MSLTPVRTDDGIDTRDGEDVIVTVNTWPPRDDQTLEDLFDEANISTPQKDLFKILFGVAELEDERDQS